LIFYAKNKFAFQHVNRTGGTSVRDVVRDLVGKPDRGSLDNSTPHRPMEIRLKWFRKFCKEFKDVPIYANVRNPFSRIVSIYSYRVGTGRFKKKAKDFKWFFYEVYLNGTIPNGPIKPFLVDKDGKTPRNLKVIKFEDLNVEWPRIIEKHFNTTVDQWPRENASEHDHWLSYFNKDMMRRVIKHERWTFKNFYPEFLELV